MESEWQTNKKRGTKKQSKGGSSQKQKSESNQQQPGGSGQQQKGGSTQQQPGGSGQQQKGGSTQQQPGGSGQQQKSGSTQQQPGGFGQQQQGRSGQQQGGWGHQQQGGFSHQQPNAWHGSGQQQSGKSTQQQLGGFSEQQQGRSGQQQQGRSGQQQQGRSGQQQGGSSHQQPNAWHGSGQQQKGGSTQQQPGGFGQQQKGGSTQQQPGGFGQQHQGRSGQQQQGREGWSEQRREQGNRFQQQDERAGQYQNRQSQQSGYGQTRQGGSGHIQQQSGPRYQQRTERSGAQEQPTDIKPISTSPARGTLGTKFVLETNYLVLNLDKMPDAAYHYDVKIELYNSDPKKIKAPPKRFMHDAFEAYAKQVLPNYKLAYDGIANAYSADKLPEKVLNENEGVLISAQVDKDNEQKSNEEKRSVKFLVTLKATQDIKIDLKSLKTYQKERIFDKPMRALQCIEVVLKTACQEKGVRGGRSYFLKPDSQLDLGGGYELWYGLYQAAMLCDIPLLNVDVSHKSFPSDVNLVEFYQRNDLRGLSEYLKGLIVVYTPPTCFKAEPKRYKFNEVCVSSDQKMLNLDGKGMTVAEYFLSKGYKLKYPKLPCLHVGSTVQNIYIPLELVTVPPGQAIIRKDNDFQIRKMISFAATSTIVRKQKIMDLIRGFNYYVHPIVERFGISIGKDFIKIEARLLNPPKIEYSEKKMTTIFQLGEWNAGDSRFYDNGNKNDSICQWAIVNFSDRISEMKLSGFLELIKSVANQRKMNLADKCKKMIMCTNHNDMKENNVQQTLSNLKKENIGLVFVILPPFKTEHYSTVKKIAETKCGVVTQCIKSDTIYKPNSDRRINQMTVNNILLKVNAKLNGTNHKIADQNTINLQKNHKIMFVGADVSHPSPLQKDIPSIVGVVASHDQYGAKYNMQYRLQEPKVETIVGMKEIFAQHLQTFKEHMKVFPDVVVYYRDGVSDAQFKDIEKVELKEMREACKAVKCEAKFTCIVVVKRHHTRFFPFKNDAEGKFQNVKAGTVVDKTIIHPNEKQFFMVSHKSIQGTAKPTRYNVIVDDSNIPIDDLQTLTYNLCHLFPRCNRSVSYPAPAYLSHLVGLRGRAYIQGKRLRLEKLNDEYKQLQICPDMKQNPMHFV